MVKYVQNLQCVANEDYENKKGERINLNHYRTSLGYVVKVRGEKRDIGTFYPMTLTLGDRFRDGVRSQYWFYNEFKPEDLTTNNPNNQEAE